MCAKALTKSKPEAKFEGNSVRHGSWSPMSFSMTSIVNVGRKSRVEESDELAGLKTSNAEPCCS